MTKVWSEAVWFCEAEYLSAKYHASEYQGNWLIIQDPIEIVLQWCSDGIVAEIKSRAELWDRFCKERPLHEQYNDRIENLEACGKFIKVTMPAFVSEPKSNFKEN